MVRLSANLSWLFKEVPFAQRFQRAAACNFKACEFLFDQYEHTNAAVAEMCATSGLTPVLLNAPAGDWASGERGFGGLPDREDEFRRSVHTALECASAISCPTIHVMAGMATGGQDEGEATFARRLRWASEEAQSAGVRVCIEPLNAKDAPGYLLPDTAAALRVLDAADHPNCHLQLDLYHFYLTESKNLEGRVFPPIPDPTPRASEGPAALRPRLRELLPRTAHVQLANPLGRHEPVRRPAHFWDSAGSELARRLFWVGALTD
jgi:hydroxypyruvate isomerase